MCLTSEKRLLLVFLCFCTIFGQLQAESTSRKFHDELFIYEIQRLAGEETMQEISGSEQGKEYLEGVLGELAEPGTYSMGRFEDVL
ncbi:MAG: hypothetical protein JXD22_03015 [Sedimentisphaerales bacterium]|nr:hypothetical protein [Sedimentisphaerales bacterium]